MFACKFTLKCGTFGVLFAGIHGRAHKRKSGAAFDYEAGASYSVRVKATDSGNLTYEKVLTISVTNVNEGPTDILLSNSTVQENKDGGTAPCGAANIRMSMWTVSTATQLGR